MPIPPVHDHLGGRAKSASRILSTFVFLIGFLTLIAWTFDLESIKRIVPGFVAMNPLTAVCFMLSSVSIFLLFKSEPSHRSVYQIGISLSYLVFILGALRLLTYVVAIDFKIDQILFQSKLNGNVMAPNTALEFCLIGLSLILLSMKKEHMSQLLAILAFFISLFALVGYSYQVSELYTVSFYIPMAVHTAFSFALISLGVLNMYPEKGFMKILTRHTAGGFIARRLLPAVILIPWILGALRLQGERAGIYPTEFGVCLLIVSNIIVFFIVVWWTARIINHSDSERKRAEAALQEANEQLETRVKERTLELEQAHYQLVQQERLRALGEMAGGIAHDFNNALSPMLGYTDLMLACPDMLNDVPQTIQHLKMINTAARDAAKIVSRLREFFRPRDQHESFKSVDLNNMVQQAVNLTQPKWKTQGMADGRDIQIKMDLGEIPLVDGNESELREVLTNLIFNATDAMPQGGTITLKTALRNKQVLLMIQDTGIGMTEEVRQRCLEPFFTTKGEKGTGLGLAMVYGIIKRHSGTVDIESEVGKGTTFFICLPGKANDQKTIGKNITNTQVRPLYILCVDDEIRTRDVTVEYLKQDGHHVDIAENGVEALKKFYSTWYDLIITDQAMPNMTGDKLAAQIKQQAPHKRIIMLSGTANLNNPDHVPEGVDVVVSKPIALEKLRQTIFQLFSDF